MADDYYGDEWGALGWTAQQPSTVAAPQTTATPLPPNFTTVTVTAKYVDGEGVALNRSMVRFRPSERRVTDGDTVVWLRSIHAWIENGVLTVDLLATDVSGVTPAFTWHVKECFPGGEEYSVTVPSATVSPVSLFSLPRA
jgi:plastocyanin